MSYGNIFDLPRFDNYHEALSYFDNTKPIRGRSFLKPLKTNRRNPHSYRMEKHPDGSIECWLYRTKVLTYYPDRIEIRTYDTQTTCKFINAIAPHWLGVRIKDCTMRVHIHGEGEFVGGSIVVPVTDFYKPKPGEVIADKVSEIVLNRTRATAARKQYQEVIELARITSKLDGYWDALRKSDADESLEKDVAWLRSILQVGSYYSHERYNGEMLHSGFRSWGVPSAEMLLPKLKKWLYERTYMTDECYDYIPAEYGVIPREWRTV